MHQFKIFHPQKKFQKTTNFIYNAFHIMSIVKPQKNKVQKHQEFEKATFNLKQKYLKTIKTTTTRKKFLLNRILKIVAYICQICISLLPKGALTFHQLATNLFLHHLNTAKCAHIARKQWARLLKFTAFRRNRSFVGHTVDESMSAEFVGAGLGLVRHKPNHKNVVLRVGIG